MEKCGKKTSHYIFVPWVLQASGENTIWVYKTAASQMLTPSKMKSILGMCTNLIFSHAFCNSTCLLVNGTEIMTVICTPHISILTLLRIVLWYKYAWSNVDLVNSGHFTLQVNECKKLLFKTRSPCPIPADIQYCKFQLTQTFSPWTSHD